ncbi:MAG: tRNA 2-methylthio-N6-isopentenyl adenosine(37) hydroxylase MiaE [Ignavibacteria bacterium]|nr:MAG: tRNA 2-methylthio-N6-isopentenyl adenosine(37) hydroxylase MiaE [Ignavibacteria bacterium]
MLNLRCDSNPEWAPAAAADLETLLSDHVHAEKKAAVTAISLINRYPERTLLVDHMIAHAQEELEHFSLVMGQLKLRGWTLRHDTADPYVNKLLSHARTSEPGRLLDSLIVAALIEARSCERFQLLIAELPEGELRDLFESLMPTEAHHYTMFMNLAREYYSNDEVDQRFAEMAEFEADIVRSLPNEPRMHG